MTALTEELPWFRLYTEFGTDPIVQMLAFEDQRHFVMAMCMKRKGMLDKEYPTPVLRSRVIAAFLGLDAVACSEANRRLMEVGLVDASWHPLKWEKRQFASDSSTSRVRAHRERLRNDDETLQRRSGNGLDTDKESDTEQKIPPTPQRGDRSLEVNRIFDHWRTIHDHPKAVLDKKRRALINAALQSYDEQTLKDAISGYKNSPHHTGLNERNTAYNTIELILRDAKHIDQGLQFFRTPPKGAAPKKESAEDVEWRVAIDVARKEGFMRDPKPGETVEQFREATKAFTRVDTQRTLQRLQKTEGT